VGHGLNSQGSIPRRGKRFFSTVSSLALGPTKPRNQWVLGAFSLGVKLTTHLQEKLRSGMVELYLHSPIHLYDIVLNELSMNSFTLLLV
jgi:hypothetical protein